MGKRSVAVRILGQEYHIRSDADEEWLQKVAGCVDDTMTQIRERTGTVDTLDVAILASLNLAREVLALRGRLDADSRGSLKPDDGRLRTLIELAESALADGVGAGWHRVESASSSEAALLDLPTGSEVDSVEQSLLGPLEPALEGEAGDASS